MDKQIKIQHETVKGEVLIGAINTFQKNRVFVAFLGLFYKQSSKSNQSIYDCVLMSTSQMGQVPCCFQCSDLTKSCSHIITCLCAPGFMAILKPP